MKNIRRAEEDDAIVFFRARYSPEAMAMSKNKDEVSYEHHLEWFRKQNKENMYIVQENDVAVGYVRISDDKKVSIAVYPWEMKKRICDICTSANNKKI